MSFNIYNICDGRGKILVMNGSTWICDDGYITDMLEDLKTSHYKPVCFYGKTNKFLGATFHKIRLTRVYHHYSGPNSSKRDLTYIEFDPNRVINKNAKNY